LHLLVLIDKVGFLAIAIGIVVGQEDVCRNELFQGGAL
jgi:hypothetical protein